MKYNAGDVVKVAPRYDGNGRYSNDCVTGIATIVGQLPPCDYYVRVGNVEAVKSEWEYIIHQTRVEK